jgi:hypothetical protein
MSVKVFLKKVAWYQKKHGSIELLKLFIVKNWRRLNNKGIMYLFDLKTMPTDRDMSRQGIAVACYKAAADIPINDMTHLIDLKSKEILLPFLKSFFDRGATLWLGKDGEKIVSLCWTKVGGFQAYYSGLIIWPDEAIILAVETFSEFRGLNYCPVMIGLICKKLKEYGVSRVYIGTHIKNISMQRSLSKTNAKRIGIVRTYKLFNRYITIWNEESMMMDYRI